MMYGYGQGIGYAGMMGGGGLGGLLMFVSAALVIIGIVLLVIWIVRTSGGHTAMGTPPHAGSTGHEEAVAIAKRRPASGEITKDQYDEIMRALGVTS
jgi:uncharacterized membrane protein